MNFEFSKDGILAHKAYNIGAGRFWPWSTFTALPVEAGYWWAESTFSDGDFVKVSHRVEKKPTDVPQTELDEEEDGNDSNNLFACPEGGCVRSYMTYRGLSWHIIHGKHTYHPERFTLGDAAKRRQAKRLEAGATRNVTSAPSTAASTSDVLPLPSGWAHRETHKRHARFSRSKDLSLKEFFKTARRAEVRRHQKRLQRKCVRRGMLTVGVCLASRSFLDLPRSVRSFLALQLARDAK
ncbi:uncharacterized protein LOC116617537 [Nematostella vectensis]|uniref:uncharacterized protein LOC116617537 n=1 Tax=Nematostella vectensis TaxID=45351 RepID=UPI002077588D|nr:uncharacterized protein LOC116617537 [Nematostella vectensis]